MVRMAHSFFSLSFTGVWRDTSGTFQYKYFRRKLLPWIADSGQRFVLGCNGINAAVAKICRIVAIGLYHKKSGFPWCIYVRDDGFNDAHVFNETKIAAVCRKLVPLSFFGFVGLASNRIQCLRIGIYHFHVYTSECHFLSAEGKILKITNNSTNLCIDMFCNRSFFF